MNTKQYVQHISGQGKKWELFDTPQVPSWKAWVVPHKEEDDGLLYLPKSEYLLCEPPGEWEDVTDRFGANDICITPSIDSGFLRIRKIDHLHNGPCFIIERKKS